MLDEAASVQDALTCLESQFPSQDPAIVQADLVQFCGALASAGSSRSWTSLSHTLEHEAHDASAQRLRKVVQADAALRDRLRHPRTTGQKLRLATEILVGYARVRRARSRAPLPEQLGLLRRR